ncbi:translation elongation factor Ts [Candidatus Peregrinibacteria bacterium]|nr:translation elongation factor Ts [Candidatus Peregrinibacteria bacterium]
MAITIDQIKELRQSTGVSMTACKKALEEAEGDFDKAVDILRKKGEAKAEARSAKATVNGIVFIKSEGNKSAMVELQCETDFVAMSDDFMDIAEKIADKLLNGEIKPDEKELPEIKEGILKLGENVKVGNMAVLEGENLGKYIHSNKRIGVIVSLEAGDPELARDIAMHIAATAPEFISPEDVSKEMVDKEKEIWKEQLKEEGKPEEIVDKILMGKEKKFREESALISQPFVKDPEKTVEELLKDADAVVKKFERFAI